MVPKRHRRRLQQLRRVRRQECRVWRSDSKPCNASPNKNGAWWNGDYMWLWLVYKWWWIKTPTISHYAQFVLPTLSSLNRRQVGEISGRWISVTQIKRKGEFARFNVSSPSVVYSSFFWWNSSYSVWSARSPISYCRSFSPLRILSLNTVQLKITSIPNQETHGSSIIFIRPATWSCCWAWCRASVSLSLSLYEYNTATTISLVQGCKLFLWLPWFNFVDSDAERLTKNKGDVFSYWEEIGLGEGCAWLRSSRNM